MRTGSSLSRCLVCAMVPALLPMLAPPLARAVINPRFTPADLVRTSSRVLQLEVSAPREKTVHAAVVTTLKGDAFAEKEIEFEIDESLELTRDEVVAPFTGGKTATAVLVLRKSRDKQPRTDEPAGAIQIGIQWFAVLHQDGRWRLGPDRQDLSAVWAGSADELANATRYVLADPAARFPVRSDITWKSELHLGKLAGRANACMAVDFGDPIGVCALVLSSGGDRVYRAGKEGSKTSGVGGAAPLGGEVTDRLKPGTTSQLAVPGDFNGDGRLDLASWDGETLRLATQTAEEDAHPRREESYVGRLRRL